LGAIADRRFWNCSNLAQIAWHDKGKGGGLPVRDGSYQALIGPRWWLSRGADLLAVLAAGAALAAGTAGAGAGDGLVHDPADGARTATALGAAAEAAIDLTGGPRRFRAGERRADVVVGQHIAGTNDHRDTVRRSVGSTRNYLRPSKIDFNQKTLLFSHSKLLGSHAIPLRATLMPR
jgi:hypothetical protein